jgi:ABC-type methionine transport system permease subunit
MTGARDSSIRAFFRHDDGRWLAGWVGGLAVLGIWDALFLNAPAFTAVRAAFLHTLLGASLAVGCTLLLGWGTATVLHTLERRQHRAVFLAATLLLNILRSVPQIIGVLIGYIALNSLIEQEAVRSTLLQVGWTSFVVSCVCFQELVDVIRERITYYRRSDFVSAMLACGIPEWRIVQLDILWKNSAAHITHKLIATFGMAVFLQCSIDFIVSVGLSSGVSLANLPVTLGGLLATLDSKQDILALGVAFSSPAYITRLPFTHLQGISVAFLIVFTLLCLFRIANGFVRRHRL